MTLFENLALRGLVGLLRGMACLLTENKDSASKLAEELVKIAVKIAVNIYKEGVTVPIKNKSPRNKVNEK